MKQWVKDILFGVAAGLFVWLVFLGAVLYLASYIFEQIFSGS